MNRPAPLGFPNGMTLRLLLPSVLLAMAFPAWASLGDNVTSVQRDSVQMKGTLRSVAAQHYVTHEIRTPNGQNVREFVSPDGNVFGVAWDASLCLCFIPWIQHSLSHPLGTTSLSVRSVRYSMSDVFA